MSNVPVISAKAGTQHLFKKCHCLLTRWVPACAGMTAGVTA
jgi:hypothetical protein